MTATKPDKADVRAAMERHRKERTVPTPEQYRRELGWELIAAERETRRSV